MPDNFSLIPIDNMTQEHNQELEQDFRTSWELFMAQGIESLEEDQIAIILFHLHHVEESDYAPEQVRFLEALQVSLDTTDAQ